MSHSKLAVLSGNRKHGRVLEERKVIERSFQFQANDVAGFAGFGGFGAGLNSVPQSRYNPEPLSGRLPASNTDTSLL